MKTSRGTRSNDTDELRKAKRLEPMRKSGKERYAYLNAADDDEEEEDYRPRRESALDYLDDDA